MTKQPNARDENERLVNLDSNRRTQVSSRSDRNNIVGQIYVNDIESRDMEIHIPRM